MFIGKTGLLALVGTVSRLIGSLNAGLGDGRLVLLSDTGESGDTGEIAGVSGLTGPLEGLGEVGRAVFTVSLGLWNAGDDGGESVSSSGVLEVDRGEARCGWSRWKLCNAAFLLWSASW